MEAKPYFIYLFRVKKTGDVILFKASNKMKFFELAEEMMECNP